MSAARDGREEPGCVMAYGVTWKPYHPYRKATKWARRQERKGTDQYGPIYREPGKVWIWGLDAEGRVCAKTCPEKWVTKHTLLADVDRINADLEKERMRSMTCSLF